MKEKIVPLAETVEEEDWSDEWELIALIDPGKFKIINELLQAEMKGKDRGRLETLSFAAVEEKGEQRLE